MSQAQDLLNNLSTTANVAEVSITPINDCLMIDAEGRITNIPNTEILLGVETDQDVERKYFKCPRIVGDNIDLSELQLMVKYQNAEGRKDKYPVDDVTINGSYIEFSWLLSDKVLAADGDVYFAVQAVRTEDDGTIKNCWNTTLASGKVLETLHVDDLDYYEEEQARDVLTQLLQLMDDKYTESIQNIQTETDTQIDNIEAAGSEQVQAITDKGVEVLASIPENYQHTHALAEEAARTKADAITKTSKGESIVVTDSSNDYLRNLRVFGKTTQVSTTGKNLLDLDKCEFSNCTYESGKVVANLTENSYYASIFTSTLNEILMSNLGNTFTFSADKGVSGRCMTIVIHGTRSDGITYQDVLGPTDSNCVTITVSELFTNITHIELRWNRATSAHADTTSVITNLQFELGDSATSYEPYTGGIASPNPDYPQDLASIGSDVEITVLGKNLLDISTATRLNAENFTIDENENKIVINPGSYLYGITFYDIPLKVGCTYTFSCISVSQHADTYGYRIGYADGTYSNNSGDKSTVTITIEKPVKSVNFYIGYNVSYDTDTVITGLQVELGSTVTEYEPYKTKQTLITQAPNGLPGIPVTDSSLATYTDSNGQMWVADEVDLERGVYIQRVATRTFDGSENWRRNGDRTHYVLDWTEVNGGWDLRLALSTHYINDSGAAYRGDSGYFAIDNNGRVYLTSSLETAEEFKAWLTDNNVTISCVLTTPIETELTATEIEAYKALQTNKLITTILNDSGAMMEVEYNADTKEYIEQYVMIKEPLGTVLMKDTATGKLYRVGVTNGSITVTEVI